MAKIIGIDLGTTNSVVSIIEGKKTNVIENMEGNRTTPSVVAFKGEEIIVGEAAKRQAVINEKTIHSIKRHMGTKKTIDINGKKYTPEEISGMILKHIKEYAEEKLGEKITQAVITVPAYFNDAQRTATKQAGKIAGLVVERIINEPTAAALAYGLEKDEKDEKILVFDLGGGTFDVSILEISDGTFEVLSTSGNNKLGGDDFDEVIIENLKKEFKQKNGFDISTDKMAMQRFKDSAEKAKKDLSGVLQTEISLPFISVKDGIPIHFESKLTRSEFESLAKDLIGATLIPLRNALKDSKLKVSEIDEVILVGGSTRIPAIRDLVQKELNKKPNTTVNPDEAVSIGAAIQGGIIGGDVKDVLLLDVTPLSLGIETLGGIMTKLIDKNTTIPTSKSQIFSTAEDNQPQVDINVLQGERAMSSQNISLGRFVLSEIKSAPRGVPQIEVKFDIDVNGIISVGGKDLTSGKEQSIKIQDSGNLSNEEVERMVREAEENKEKDEKFKEEVQVINDAQSLVSNIEAELEKKEIKEKIPADQLKQIDDQLKEFKGLIEKREIQNLKEKIDQIKKTMEMFQTFQNPTSETETNKNNIDEDVIDVETDDIDKDDIAKDDIAKDDIDKDDTK